MDMESREPFWSSSVDAGLWLRERLAPFRDLTLASFVPSDYETYARLLHPVDTPDRHDRLIRWRDVAQWSGRELTSRSQFESIAMGPGAPRNDRPWRGQGPEEGRLAIADARVLADALRDVTPSPQRCWFGLWSGYGFQRGCYGPELALDSRSYYLFSGSVDDAVTTTLLTRERHTPNLWWPEDHSWFVATEIDSQSTYVAGTRALIDHLTRDPRIEVQEVAVTDTVYALPEPWLLQLADAAARDLITHEVCEFTTTLGTLSAELSRSWRRRRWGFHVRYVMGTSGGSSGSEIHAANDEELHRQLTERLAHAALQMAH